MVTAATITRALLHPILRQRTLLASWPSRCVVRWSRVRWPMQTQRATARWAVQLHARDASTRVGMLEGSGWSCDKGCKPVASTTKAASQWRRLDPDDAADEADFGAHPVFIRPNNTANTILDFQGRDTRIQLPLSAAALSHRAVMSLVSGRQRSSGSPTCECITKRDRPRGRRQLHALCQRLLVAAAAQVHHEAPSVPTK